LRGPLPFRAGRELTGALPFLPPSWRSQRPPATRFPTGDRRGGERPPPPRGVIRSWREILSRAVLKSSLLGGYECTSFTRTAGPIIGQTRCNQVGLYRVQSSLESRRSTNDPDDHAGGQRYASHEVPKGTAECLDALLRNSTGVGLSMALEPLVLCCGFRPKALVHEMNGKFSGRTMPHQHVPPRGVVGG
jgi:hypothetical protein